MITAKAGSLAALHVGKPLEMRTSTDCMSLFMPNQQYQHFPAEIGNLTLQPPYLSQGAHFMPLHQICLWTE